MAQCSNDTFGSDGGPSDASGDVTVPTDGPEMGEAGHSDGAVTQPRFCDSVDAAFCADFDIPGDAGAGWAPPGVTPPGKLLFEMNTVLSGMFAVEADLPNTGGGASAVLGTTVPLSTTSPNALHLDVDMQVPSPPATPLIPVFYFGDPRVQFGLGMVAGSYVVVERGGTSNPLSMALPANQWLHVHMDIKLNTVSGSVSVAVTQGMNVVATGGMSGIQTEGSPAPGTVLLQIGGDDTSAPMTDVSFIYDNVVARYE